MIAETPVRIVTLPTSTFPSTLISVVYPTSTPETSVMELNLPAVPSNGIPRSRARTTFAWVLGGGGDLIGSRAEAAITRADRDQTIPFISLSLFPRQNVSIRLFPSTA